MRTGSGIKTDAMPHAWWNVFQKLRRRGFVPVRNAVRVQTLGSLAASFANFSSSAAICPKMA
jgi:hypothetical protein